MSKVYQIVTDKILEMLEQGTVPWRRPWRGSFGIPANLVSGKAYRGINHFLLGLSGFMCPYWLTRKQIAARGGQIREGERSSLITFWKKYTPKSERGKDKPKESMCFRYYLVWNVEQCDGIDYPKPEKVEHDPIEAAELIVSGMPQKPEIRHRGSQAFYHPAQDFVKVPDQGYFKDSESYYGTLFHELTHSTGHPSRVDRGLKGGSLAAFGSRDYGKEELIAEMGAAFLCAESGIDNVTVEDSAAYIGSWIKTIRGNNRLVVEAATAGQKAADFILAR